MSAMALLCRYGHVQPSEYEAMEVPVAVELASRVVELHREDTELMVELAKGVMRSNGMKVPR